MSITFLLSFITILGVLNYQKDKRQSKKISNLLTKVDNLEEAKGKCIDLNETEADKEILRDKINKLKNKTKGLKGKIKDGYREEINSIVLELERSSEYNYNKEKLRKKLELAKIKLEMIRNDGINFLLKACLYKLFFCIF